MAYMNRRDSRWQPIILWLPNNLWENYKRKTKHNNIGKYYRDTVSATVDGWEVLLGGPEAVGGPGQVLDIGVSFLLGLDLTLAVHTGE